MSFINIKKVVLEDTIDIVEASNNTMLVCASLTHDAIESKNYESAFHQINMLKASILQLEKVLDYEKSKEGK